MSKVGHALAHIRDGGRQSVPRTRLAGLLEVLNEHPTPTSLTCTKLRWWDPVTGEIEELANRAL